MASKNSFEHYIEKVLWRSRFLVWIAVIASMLATLCNFWIITVDTKEMLTDVWSYGRPGAVAHAADSHGGEGASAVDPAKADEHAQETLRAKLIIDLIEMVDGFLLATFLLIFTLGLYELFISKIDEAETSENSGSVLTIHSLDELKTRLGRVVLMILIVKLFKNAQSAQLEKPADLLMFAGAITLVSLSLYLTHAGDHGPAVTPKKEADGEHHA